MGGGGQSLSGLARETRVPGAVSGSHTAVFPILGREQLLGCLEASLTLPLLVFCSPAARTAPGGQDRF